MDFNLTGDQQMLVNTVHDYVTKTLEPIATQVESENRIPPAVLHEMGELGFFGIPIAEQYGGLDAGLLGHCLVIEQLAGANAAYANIIGASTGLAATAISLAGNEAQKQRWLPALANGEKLGGFALTEPHGAEMSNLGTAAEKDGDGYKLNGRKAWVSNGPVADTVVVFARTGDGISAYVVERGCPGYRCGETDSRMGLHGSYSSELYFNDVKLTADNLLGQAGQGSQIATATLDRYRIGLAAQAVGAADKLLRACVEYSKQRQQFGQPIAGFQAIQNMLADMATEMAMARAGVYFAAWKADNGQPFATDAAMVRLFATEMLNRVADRAVQIHGGMGYMKELWIERAYRDARMLRLAEGTNDVMRLIIANDLLRLGIKD
jgi:acyl-CoA dehydrogenase